MMCYSILSDKFSDTMLSWREDTFFLDDLKQIFALRATGLAGDATQLTDLPPLPERMLKELQPQIYATNEVDDFGMISAYLQTALDGEGPDLLKVMLGYTDDFGMPRSNNGGLQPYISAVRRNFDPPASGSGRGGGRGRGRGGGRGRGRARGRGVVVRQAALARRQRWRRGARRSVATALAAAAQPPAAPRAPLMRVGRRTATCAIDSERCTNNTRVHACTSTVKPRAVCTSELGRVEHGECRVWCNAVRSAA